MEHRRVQVARQEGIFGDYLFKGLWALVLLQYEERERERERERELEVAYHPLALVSLDKTTATTLLFPIYWGSEGFKILSPKTATRIL